MFSSSFILLIKFLQTYSFKKKTFINHMFLHLLVSMVMLGQSPNSSPNHLIDDKNHHTSNRYLAIGM